MDCYLVQVWYPEFPQIIMLKNIFGHGKRAIW